MLKAEKRRRRPYFAKLHRLIPEWLWSSHPKSTHLRWSWIMYQIIFVWVQTVENLHLISSVYIRSLFPPSLDKVLLFGFFFKTSAAFSSLPMAPWTWSVPCPKQFSIADHPLDRRKFPKHHPKLSQGDEGTIGPLNGPDPARVCFDAGMQEPCWRALRDAWWSKILFLFLMSAGRSGRRLAFSHHLPARDTHGPGTVRCWLLITRPPVKTRMADELRTSSQLDNRWKSLKIN